MARITFHIPTRNEGNGFYGTAWNRGQSDHYAEKAWDAAFQKIIAAAYALGDAPNWPDTKVRDFLDSSCGRFLADHLTGNMSRITAELEQSIFLRDTLTRFSKEYDSADYN